MLDKQHPVFTGTRKTYGRGKKGIRKSGLLCRYVIWLKRGNDFMISLPKYAGVSAIWSIILPPSVYLYLDRKGSIYPVHLLKKS